MSTSHPIEAPPRAGGPAARGFVRFLYTHNPFYVISAWFMFTGLRLSFDPQGGMFNTTSLMVSLAAYTLLLAGTAWLLIHLGQVWQDVRGLLLLIVMMFMAVSVVIDDVLAVDLERGAACYLAGLVFCVGLSELLLRTLGIRLKALYRFPYYLLLALFFLYPLALGIYLVAPASPWLPWGLLAFPAVAGILALSLLPAIRRGPDYVRHNGTPWRWPLFPWTLFVFLGGGICLRAYYLCVSLHQIGGASTIFGIYFLAPLAWSVSLLIQEAGLSTGSRRAQKASLLLPILCVIAVALPYDGGFAYRRFLAMFVAELGGSPLYYTLCGAILFHALALWRRVPLADVALAGSLAALTLVRPATMDLTQAAPLWSPGLAAASAVLLTWGLWNRNSWRTLLGALCLIGTVTVAARDTSFVVWYGFVPLNLVLASLFVVGILFSDLVGRLANRLAALATLVAAVTALIADAQTPGGLPVGLVCGYPLLLALATGIYARAKRDRLYQAVTAGNVAASLAAAGAKGYGVLRPHMPGLDEVLIGLLFFFCAIATSLVKAGQLPRLVRSLARPEARETGIDSTA